MAFIRAYQRFRGDPFAVSLSTIRAGQLLPRRLPVVAAPRRKAGTPAALLPILGGGVPLPTTFGRPNWLGPAAGDPFLGKLFKKAGKALKKVTLKGVVKGVANVAKVVAPIALPGIGGLAAGLIASRVATGAPPPAEYAEPIAAPVMPLELDPVAADPGAALGFTDAQLMQLFQLMALLRAQQEVQ